jgi:hypothetical protein
MDSVPIFEGTHRISEQGSENSYIEKEPRLE